MMLFLFAFNANAQNLERIEQAGNKNDFPGKQFLAKSENHENRFTDRINKQFSVSDMGRRLNFTKELSYNWDTIITYNENDELYHRYSRIYTSQGQTEIHLRETWNGSTNAWENDAHETYTYDANGNRLTSLLSEGWNSTTNDWENDRRWTYTYDANGNRLTDLQEDWNSATNTWGNDRRNIYTYDANGNMLTQLYEEWNSTTNDWKNELRWTYTYDGNGNSITGIYEEWDGSNWSPPMFGGGLNLYSNKHRLYYVYGYYRYEATYKAFENTSVEETVSNRDVKVFPNPAKQHITVKTKNKSLQNLQILDISGKTILNRQINSTENKYKIDLSAFKCGIYIIKIQTNEEVITKKIIKE